MGAAILALISLIVAIIIGIAVTIKAKAGSCGETAESSDYADIWASVIVYAAIAVTLGIAVAGALKI